MERSNLWARAVLCAALLFITCGAETSDSEIETDLETRNIQEDFYRQSPNLTNEKRLLGALHEVLEKLQTKRINPWEKKFGQLPTCDLGEHCAVRKGARIGKMCDCPRGAFCNFFLLKCL
ncbi:cocaine- and amphetamine-regulated transcript 2 [Esox lucius]|uniref:Uncharacterized protein n=1 Tax=Esox lucius TaxID=8010 RepID=A0A3P8XH23_ESOLU|nr:cocaine- and amphetamine-regulated transcript 2 [Esox lucius]